MVTKVVAIKVGVTKVEVTKVEVTKVGAIKAEVIKAEAEVTKAVAVVGIPTMDTLDMVTNDEIKQTLPLARANGEATPDDILIEPDRFFFMEILWLGA